MKRLLTSLAGAALLGAALLAPVSAAPSGSDASGPGCRDITDGAGNYDGTTLNFQMVVGDGIANCKNITYTLIVYPDDSTSTPLITVTQNGDGTSLSVDFVNVLASQTDGFVCVVGTTSTGGKKPFDRAPDNGCVDVGAGGVGGVRFK